MQYSIPQFIEIEDKVVGPLTVKQFLYLVAGGVFLVIAWSLVDLGLFIFLAIITGVIVVPFAFIKINGRPFQVYLTAAIRYFTTPHLRIWMKTKEKPYISFSDVQKREIKRPEGQTEIIGEKRFNPSRIRQLSHILDVGGKV